MKYLITTIAAVVLVGCGESQQSAPAPEVKPTQPIAEAAKPEPPTPKTPDILIHEAAAKGDIEAVKKHLADGADVNAKNDLWGPPLIAAAASGHKEIVELFIAEGADVHAKADETRTPLREAALEGHREIAKLLIAKGSDVNAMGEDGKTILDWAAHPDNPNADAEIADLLRKHGGKTGAELKAEGK